jgi:hypothetical protein
VEPAVITPFISRSPSSLSLIPPPASSISISAPTARRYGRRRSRATWEASAADPTPRGPARRPDPRPHPPPRGHGRILEAEGSLELEDIHSPHVVPYRARLRAALTGFLAAAWPSILLPLPLLCARGSWRPWQVVGPCRLQESLHRAKSEGGGGRRDFRVINPVPRCRLDSGEMPTRNGWRDGSRPLVWMV